MFSSYGKTKGWEVLRFALEGWVLLEPKPLPIFKGHFGRKKVPIFRIFLKLSVRNFGKTTTCLE